MPRNRPPKCRATSRVSSRHPTTSYSHSVLNVLNLGGGVQSTALALMLDRGELSPRPDIAIHADTQSDPPGVMARVTWLAQHLSYEVRVVRAPGPGVAADLLAGVNSTGQTYSTPPSTSPTMMAHTDRHADNAPTNTRSNP